MRSGAHGSAGLPVVAGLSIVFAVIERAPTAILALIANGIYPPVDVQFQFPFPSFPGIAIPQSPFPVVTFPGEFGSGIPWGVHIGMVIANLPFFAFLTVLYTGAALSFADADLAPLDPEQFALAQASRAAR